MRAASSMVVILMLSASLTGCFGDEVVAPEPEEEGLPQGWFVTGADGLPVDVEALNLSFVFSNVGEDGAEPSIGITSSGWQHPSTSDPWLWVDPVTDRIFDVQMVGLLTTWIAWSDDDGVNWLGNPHDSGPIPLNDHIKLGSGPWTDDGYGLAGGLTSNIYETAVYFCYNKGVGIFCYTSFDGGASWTVYVTPRVATPTIVFSKDNGFSWEQRTMGEDVGTPNPRKNSEVATDSESNAYHVWVGADHGIYMSRSTDSGNTWEQESTRLSPAEVISTTFPHIDAGDPGRIAITYLGSENASALNTSNIDGVAWDGNPHYAPANVSYYLYITYSLNALDPEPVFHTVRVSPDPVQVGSICLNSGDCRDIGGSNRNLLDFNDLHIDREGRVYVAFADGCIDSCASSNNSTPEDSRGRLGAVYYLGSGPSLFESVGDLAEFEM